MESGQTLVRSVTDNKDQVSLNQGGRRALPGDYRGAIFNNKVFAPDDRAVRDVETIEAQIGGQHIHAIAVH